jgi:hypothetical protein
VEREFMAQDQILFARPVSAASDMWDVFALIALGASVVLPIFPFFHPFAHAAYFSNVFDHPVAFAGAEL